MKSILWLLEEQWRICLLGVEVTGLCLRKMEHLCWKNILLFSLSRKGFISITGAGGVAQSPSVQPRLPMPEPRHPQPSLNAYLTIQAMGTSSLKSSTNLCSSTLPEACWGEALQVRWWDKWLTTWETQSWGEKGYAHGFTRGRQESLDESWSREAEACSKEAGY